MTGSNCVHHPSDDIDDVTLGDYVTLPVVKYLLCVSDTIRSIKYSECSLLLVMLRMEDLYCTPEYFEQHR
jgi:hypothetical protein